MVLVVFVHADLEALEEDLVEHAPDLLWCMPVGVGGVLGELDGHSEVLFVLVEVDAEGFEVAIYGGEFQVEALLFGAERLDRDRIVVMSFEEFALLPLGFQLLGGEGLALPVRVFRDELQFLPQGGFEPVGFDSERTRPPCRLIGGSGPGTVLEATTDLERLTISGIALSRGCSPGAS